MAVRHMGRYGDSDASEAKEGVHVGTMGIIIGVVVTCVLLGALLERLIDGPPAPPTPCPKCCFRGHYQTQVRPLPDRRSYANHRWMEAIEECPRCRHRFGSDIDESLITDE